MTVSINVTDNSAHLVSPETDWDHFFEDAENLNYRLLVEHGKTYLLTESIRVNVNNIPNFHNMKGDNLDAPEWQKARYRRGYWLELAVQVALRKAKINFEGNSTNLNHYPHSKGLCVGIDTENMLIECTNVTKWLGFEEWQEKINYFHKADPKHRKTWILITTWQKCIPKLIRQQILNYNITVLFTNRVANGKNHNDIAEQLVQPLKQALTGTINNQNPTPNNLTPKNRYQTIPNIDPVVGSDVCVGNNLKNSSGLDG